MIRSRKEKRLKKERREPPNTGMLTAAQTLTDKKMGMWWSCYCFTLCWGSIAYYLRALLTRRSSIIVLCHVHSVLGAKVSIFIARTRSWTSTRINHQEVHTYKRVVLSRPFRSLNRLPTVWTVGVSIRHLSLSAKETVAAAAEVKGTTGKLETQRTNYGSFYGGNASLYNKRSALNPVLYKIV